MSIEDVADKRLGPLPLAAWAGIAIVGVGGGLYFRKYFAGSSTSTPSASGTVDDVTTAGGTNLNTAGNLGSNVYGDTSTTGSSAPSISTNDDWRTAAERILVGLGYDPAVVDSAVGKYLTGTGLSSQEYAVVDEALSVTGPTPEYVPAATQVATSTDGGDASTAPATATVAPTAAQLADAAIANLPKINSSDWAVNLGSNADITQIGTGGPGGFYNGHNVGDGAPVYALINGQWQQDFNWKTLAPNTKIGTPTQLANYAYSDTITTTFGS